MVVGLGTPSRPAVWPSSCVHSLLLVFSTATNCTSPNLTLITYTNGRKDNFFCRQECGKLPGGRLAVPRTQTQYDCLTGLSGHGHNTPFWTGIRVRQTGGLMDPLTNRALPMLGNPETGWTMSTIYRTLSPEAWDGKVYLNKSKVCIYLHDNYYVEAGCSFTHEGKTPIQCACYTGNLQPEKVKLQNLISVKLVIFGWSDKKRALREIYPK